MNNNYCAILLDYEEFLRATAIRKINEIKRGEVGFEDWEALHTLLSKRVVKTLVDKLRDGILSAENFRDIESIDKLCVRLNVEGMNLPQDIAEKLKKDEQEKVSIRTWSFFVLIGLMGVTLEP